MKTKLPLNIVEEFAHILKIEFHALEIKFEFKSMDFKDTNDIKNIVVQMIEIGRLVHLSFLENQLKESKFIKVLKGGILPVMVFIRISGEVCPFLIQSIKRNKITGKLIYEDQVVNKSYIVDELFQILVFPENYLKYLKSDPNAEQDSTADSQGSVFFITPLKINASKGKSHEASEFLSGHSRDYLSPVTRLWRLMISERKDIGFIYIYAIAIGLLSLTTPLGIQAIISLISGGMIPQTVVLLFVFVIVGTLFSGGLQILQTRIVETLKQRIFANAAFEFAFRVPKIKMEALANDYAPELMNRFFDVLTIQKGYAKILIDMLGASIQIVFGLILLSFYHPLFILFGFFLIGVLSLIFYFTGIKGLKSSLMESKYKYRVAHWLEEVARTVTTFKLAGFTNLSLEKTDLQVGHFLKKRQSHFKVLMSQYISIVIFKVLITGGILILGSILVVDRQITLGQFVASELVIIMIMQAVEKIILNLDSVYDVLTAVDKVGHVTDLPLESTGGVSLSEINPNQGFDIKIKNLKYIYPGTSEYVLNGININVPSGKRLGVIGGAGSGKTTFINVITGLYESYEGIVAFNGLSLRDINISSFRDEIGDNLPSGDIFEGTLEENVSVGKSGVSVLDVVWALEKVGLSDFVQSLSQGIHTPLIAGGKKLPSTITKKIILARSIAEQPRLIVFDDFFANMPNTFTKNIVDFIMEGDQPWTVIASTNNPIVLSKCDEIIILEDGLISSQGTFTDLVKKGDIWEFIPYLGVYPHMDH